ncbi:histidine phosphatase family protein [Mycobacterium neglectum]|jgi:broad specificity phosphatase PhoE|uniref:histidine phosphatase family protein n=1 Tax=Mycobacterium neglectum TaxID=242737 RepID=UPI000BFF1577|nr:histidine phosphatase family protein [Mycobacterium neglectum]
MAQHVYLVRHGETSLNADGRLRGLADPELNEIGAGQAGAVAVALAGVGADVVVSSPLRRAVHTAAAIARHVGVTHQIDDRFNDRDYGQWTGAVKSEVIAQWGSVDAAPGVEPTEAVLSRSGPALDEWGAWAQSRHKAVVVVTHDAVIRPLLARVAPSLPAVSVPTGSYQVLRYDSGIWSVELTDQQAPLLK